ncbi:unnamed protein product [Meloidogyne enterolobii]
MALIILQPSQLSAIAALVISLSLAQLYCQKKSFPLNLNEYVYLNWALLIDGYFVKKGWE